MDKLVETNCKLAAATMEQNQVNRQLAISAQLPKILIRVFIGEPLQYPTWNSPLVLLNQYIPENLSKLLTSIC